MSKKNLNVTLFTAAAAMAAFSGSAMAQHAGDILVSIDNGRLSTALSSEDEPPAVTPGVRVFGAELGEDVPNITDEPGFDSPEGEFLGIASLGFNIRSALRVWDGADFDAIATPQMGISFGPASVLTPLADILTPGISLNVTPEGDWHNHFTFELNAPATDGVYLLELELFASDPSIQTSLPFWIVFNQNADEADHDAAIDWATANLAPTPGTAGALLMSLGVIGARRRRA